MVAPIAIIGGGPSGLTLARLLEVKGIDYVVYERDDAEPSVPQGGSLDLHPDSGQLALKQAGLFDEFLKHARYDATVFNILDKNGTSLLKIGDGRDAPEIDRPMLRKILLESIPKEKILWGHGVKSVDRDQEGKVVVTFQNGKTETGFKLLVGADGAWSKTRHLLTPVQPIYSGKMYIETSVTPTNPFHGTLKERIGPGSLMAVAPKQNVLAMCQGDGSYKVYASVSVAADFAKTELDIHNKPDEARQLLVERFFGDWSNDLTEMILKADGKIREWPLYYLPPDELPWKQVSGVTLLGDAAHLTTPFVGEGVNCAMTDAMRLAEEIGKHGVDGLDEAVKAYEEDMIPRGVDLIQRSQGAGELFYGAGSPGSVVDVFSGGGGGDDGTW
ncbi:hypothetical protein B0H66DRAFT_547117 [Apodospora peruviana]|uniref:FAD-binding domain-containing protein n=1 Tax=Apodospora peruviana TaxID=516989 RepID=A0AAE0MA18_9PEZI|nr:hypothetical protein B0H66DRAFT_547117 [Apodospora peruviana]